MNKLWTNLKSWYGVLFLVLLAGGVLWSVLNGLPHINNLRAKWEAQRLQNQWEKPYREDKYGGKTPEETYDMFLDALRKGDTTLASKYFVIESQDEWVDTLNELKNGEKLDNLISELEHAKTMWKKTDDKDKEIIIFEYETTLSRNSTVNYDGQTLDFPAGQYINSTEFHRYPNGIWKIYAL